MNNNLTFGALWCIGGAVILAVSYGLGLSHTAGTQFMIACGAMIFGGIQFFRGLTERNDFGHSRAEAQLQISKATWLKDVDRNRAIARYREIVRLFPNTPASREAKRSIEILSSQRD